MEIPHSRSRRVKTWPQYESTRGVRDMYQIHALQKRLKKWTGKTGVAAWLMLRANVFAVVVEMPLLLAFDLM